MECFDLRKPGWREMKIALNGKSQRPSRCDEVGEPEVAELVFKPNHPAEEQVVPVELEDIPCPGAIRREELADHERVFHLFLRREQWKVFSYLLWQQFDRRTSLSIDEYSQSMQQKRDTRSRVSLINTIRQYEQADC